MRTIIRNARAPYWALVSLSLGAALCAGAASLITLLEDRNAINTLDAEAWRPPLLLWGGSLLMIAWIFGVKVRKCQAPISTVALNRSMISIVIPLVATVLMALSAGLPSFLPTLNEALEPKWPATVSSNAVSLRVNIPTMDCGTCMRGIDLMLRKQVGLERADFSLDKKEAVIWYDPMRTSKTSVIATLKTHGFAATAVE